jgi:hypothetical protein
VIAGKQGGTHTGVFPFFSGRLNTLLHANFYTLILMLHITQISSFKMTRKFKDNSEKTARRYVYLVTGDSADMAVFKKDTLAKTNPGGMVAENGDLRFYSWRKVIGGTAELKRGKNGNWFIDTEAIDDLESLAEQSPALMKAVGDSLLNRILGAGVKPGKAVEPIAEPDDEENEPF